MYQLRKLIARNKLAAGFVGTLLVVSVVFGVFVAYQSRQVAQPARSGAVQRGGRRRSAST